MIVVLVSTYDLGRQPFGLASPAAWLREAGCQVACLDLSRGALDPDAIRRAGLVGFFLPMHTATRLVEPVVRRVRAENPSAHLCAYGLYAQPNEAWLKALGVHTVLGAEFEADLAGLASRLSDREEARDLDSYAAPSSQSRSSRTSIPRLSFRVPDRVGLPALDNYARLHLPDGSQRVVGYTEASRGCKHLCRHCPIVPVYDGRFRVVPLEVVLADVRQQVAAGARHVTFGDPDFFNGIGHAMRVVDAFAAEFPAISYDVTIKVEHLLRHEPSLVRLRDTGCILVTTAVEALDDDVLERLAKGHTRRDFERALETCRAIGLPLAPTFIPFTPWTTIDGYHALLDAIDALDLVTSVPPIQLTLRLLIPEGSGLLALRDVQALVEPFDQRSLVYPWRHPDPAVDSLQREAMGLVRRMASGTRERTFAALRALAHEGTGHHGPRSITPRPRTSVPYLNEPWYC